MSIQCRKRLNSFKLNLFQSNTNVNNVFQFSIHMSNSFGMSITWWVSLSTYLFSWWFFDVDSSVWSSIVLPHSVLYVTPLKYFIVDVKVPSESEDKFLSKPKPKPKRPDITSPENQWKSISFWYLAYLVVYIWLLAMKRKWKPPCDEPMSFLCRMNWFLSFQSFFSGLRKQRVNKHQQ